MSNPVPIPAAPGPAAVSRVPTTSNAHTRARAADLRAGRVPFVMATVVRAERPTSAKAGDVAVVLGDGRVEGFVGGECAEASVRHQALQALETGQPVLLRISPSASPDAAPPRDGSAVPDGDQGVITVHNPCQSGGTLEIFLEPDLPPPILVVHGNSPTALALASLAEHLGYIVERCDDVAGTDAGSPLSGPESTAGFTGAAAVVVASHGRGEEAVLTAAVRAEIPYIGLVASRTRGAAVLERLDVGEESKSAIHTPAGLDLGARKPQEIALSILAEIMSTRPKRTGGAGNTQAPAAPTLTPATDPVCGMMVAVVSSALAAEHSGVRYFFCGPGCRDAFVADPTGVLARR